MVLDAADESPLSPGERVELERHRMLCLIALGRPADAADAATRLLEEQPGYALSEGDAAPHVRAMLDATRRRVVPAMIRRTYDDGRRAFDEGEFGRAGEAFAQLGQWLADARVADADPGFVDLRTLSDGFLQLSMSRAARDATEPPAAPPTLLAVASRELSWSGVAAVRMDPASIDAPAEDTEAFATAGAGAASTAPPPFAPLDFFTFDARDEDVVPPQAVSQEISGWWGAMGEPPAGTPLGAIDLVIDDAGRVVEARIHQSVNRVYDAVLLQSARQWRYRPASRDGRPVRYRRITSIVSVR